MPSTILIVDDEKDILELLEYNLTKEGYRVVTASNGRTALKLAHQKPDLIVLDVMMPKTDGWEVCRTIRGNRATANIPVIFLTAKDSEVDEIVGLELGADDYIRKPVKIRTFVARVKRALRSTAEHKKGLTESVLRIGDIEIQLTNYRVRMKGKEIHFPKKEFEVLVFLARHPDRIVTRETILNEVWGHDVYVVDRTVDVHVRKIREKLGVLAHHIETVKGVGYRFKKDA